MSKTSNATDTKAVSKPPKHKGIRLPYEQRKAMYGYGFIAIWAIGSIYFFIIPLIKSLIY